MIRDIDPEAYTKPKLSASKAERKTAKAARREEVNRRKAVQEETSLIAMRVFEKLLARESRSEVDQCAKDPNSFPQITLKVNSDEETDKHQRDQAGELR